MPDPFPILLAAASLALALTAQDPAPTAPVPTAHVLTVRVPTFPNSTCPIMGKKVSLPLFADTELGRIYVCCKPCIKKVHADVQAAYATAYPATVDAANAVCPVSGEPIGEDRVTVLLQGVRVPLCCAGCVDAARKDAQVVLTRVREPKLVDVGNVTCPVDGQPVQPNAFVVVGDAIVRLSSPAHAAEVEKAPRAKLEAARAIRSGQALPAPHRHAPRGAPGGLGR